MKTSLSTGSKVLFIGDSITDCDRRAAEHAPLGWGYVDLLRAMLTVREPEKEIAVVNKGIGGQTISHLLSRWRDDVVEHDPQVIVVQIGINDATRYLDRSTSLHCAPEAFGKVYVRLVEESRRGQSRLRILLIPPFFISRGDDTVGSYRSELIQLLRAYVEQVEIVASSLGLQVIDVQRTFDDLLRHKRADVYSEDGIHPNAIGHLAIAEEVYRALSKEA
jgi:lysophospholipase L1-like esterase